MTTAATMVKKEAEKKPFQERWGALPAQAQARFYRTKCRELLAPPRYSSLTADENGGLLFMRDNMKKMQNGKEHPKVEPLMSC